MTTLLIPMGPIDFPWWFIAALIVFWAAAVTLPAAVPLAAASVLLARKRSRSTRRYGAAGFALGAVLAVAIYWMTGSAGSDGSFVYSWLPGWLLAAVVAFVAGPSEPRAV